MDVVGCPLPDDLLYDPENDVWLRLGDGESSATLGMTAPILSFAGRISSFSFRPAVPRVEAGRSVATVESARYTGAIRCPVRATVAAQNRDLPGRPRLLNDAPYAEGWVVRLSEVDPGEARRRLLTADQARPVYQEKIERLRIECYPAIPDSQLYEIGAECAAVLAQLDAELARRTPGEVVLLVTDDPTAPIEMVRWSDRTGHSVLDHRRRGALHHFLVRREREPKPRLRGAGGR